MKYPKKKKLERERTVFVGDMDVKEEELEGRGVGANDLLKSPFEGALAANRGVWIALDARLVHCDHYPSWLTLHFPHNSLSHSLSVMKYDCLWVSKRIDA